MHIERNCVQDFTKRPRSGCSCRWTVHLWKSTDFYKIIWRNLTDLHLFCPSTLSIWVVRSLLKSARLLRRTSLRLVSLHDKMPCILIFVSEFVPKLPTVELDDASNFVNGSTSRRYYIGEINGIARLQGEFDKLSDKHASSGLKYQANSLLSSLKSYMEDIKYKRSVSFERLRSTMFRAAACVITLPVVHPELLHYLVTVPVQLFTPESLLIGTDIWNWLLIERPDMEKRLMVEMLSMWGWAQRHRKGLFSPILK